VIGAELNSIPEVFDPSPYAMGKAFGCSSPKANIAPRIRRVAVGLALILIAIGLPHSRAIADDAGGLIGRWLVPSGEQKKSRMSPQCQQYAETDVQTVPESEIEIFSCDDPAFAPQKARIVEFVKAVNEVYRAQNRPLYSETISGLCGSCARRRRNGRPIFATRAKSFAGLKSQICRSSGISGHRRTTSGH
jgi:hypothetical protein